MCASATNGLPSQFPSRSQDIAVRGQEITVHAILEARNIVQWWIYYPAVLDPLELGLTTVEQQQFAVSLEAYGRGDLVRALQPVLPIPGQSTVTTKTSPPVEQVKTITLSESSEQKTKVVRKAGTTVGAAQKDTARGIGAKLSSMKGIMWVGVLVFLFGAASLVYPPLRAIAGSATTSAMACGSGVVLIVLPTLMAGNETLILFTVLGVLLAYFFAHRHGKLQGFVDAKQPAVPLLG